MDPIGLESILEKFWKMIGFIVPKNKGWDEVISCCSDPSVECCSLLNEFHEHFGKDPCGLLEQLRESLAKGSKNIQQNGEQYVFFNFFPFI